MKQTIQACACACARMCVWGERETDGMTARKNIFFKKMWKEGVSEKKGAADDPELITSQHPDDKRWHTHVTQLTSITPGLVSPLAHDAAPQLIAAGQRELQAAGVSRAHAHQQQPRCGC